MLPKVSESVIPEASIISGFGSVSLGDEGVGIGELDGPEREESAGQLDSA